MARLIFPLLLTALPLAGCALNFAGSQPEVAVRAIDNGTVDQQAAGTESLAAGREAMRGGNLMAAMSAFRVAQRDPATVAEATNGIGVAWATLGRHDLAEKAFLEAVAFAPQDRRFAANLERVLAHKILPAAPAGEQRQQFAGPLPRPLAPSRPVNRAIQVEGPGNSLVRVSRTEVRFGTRSTPAAAAISAANPTAGPASGQPVIRVALPRAGDRLYPLRVALPAASPARQARASAAYPLRVAMPATAAPATSRTRTTAAYPLRVALRAHRAGTKPSVTAD